jgi:hypothetical protein
MKIRIRLECKKYLVIFLLSPVVFFSCKSLNPAAIPPPVQAPVSQFSANVPLVVPKHILDQILQVQIPQILFDQKSLDMGNGIEGDLKFSRTGDLTWKSIDGQKLQLSLPIRIQGQLGLKKGGLGSFFKSKVPIDKSFKPILTFNPAINSDWKLEFLDFGLLELGGKIDLSVLGFEIDLSSIVQREISNIAAQNFGAGRPLLDLKVFASKQWNQIAKPVILEIGSQKTGFSIQPQSIKFKEFFDTNQNLNIWIGLDGTVRPHPEGVFPAVASPLPAVLESNQRSENKLSLNLPIALPYRQLDKILEENLAGKTIQVDKKTTLQVSNSQTSPYGELLAVNMDFVAQQNSKKPVTGKLFAVGRPVYDAASKYLRLADVNFKMTSKNLGAQTGIRLKKRNIISQLEKRAVFSLENQVQKGVQELQDRLKQETLYADFQLIELQLIPGNFYPTANELIIEIKLAGKMDVRWK